MVEYFYYYCMLVLLVFDRDLSRVDPSLEDKSGLVENQKKKGDHWSHGILEISLRLGEI